MSQWQNVKPKLKLPMATSKQSGDLRHRTLYSPARPDFDTPSARFPRKLHLAGTKKRGVRMRATFFGCSDSPTVTIMIGLVLLCTRLEKKNLCPGVNIPRDGDGGPGDDVGAAVVEFDYTLVKHLER
ncbi:hypothetical protein BJV74DRAFT_794530 [Russula compacta]|nr:hypothetical protein BJV74DRAFT_794530 [Russula compacta]